MQKWSLIVFCELLQRPGPCWSHAFCDSVSGRVNFQAGWKSVITCVRHRQTPCRVIEWLIVKRRLSVASGGNKNSLPFSTGVRMQSCGLKEICSRRHSVARSKVGSASNGTRGVFSCSIVLHRCSVKLPIPTLLIAAGRNNRG